MTQSKLSVAEIFGPTLQGEGALAGQKTMFIRFAYCDGAGGGWCRWCDSLYAVDPKNRSEWQFLDAQEVFDIVDLMAAEGCKHVTLTGGNPALYELGGLVKLLRSSRYTTHVETQGTVFRPWLLGCTTVTVSPKPPSAGECDVIRFMQFMEAMMNPMYPSRRLICKIVVDPSRDDDYDFARRIFSQYPRNVEKYLSALTLLTDDCGTLLERYRRLADRVVADPDFQDVGVLPQLHVVLWGHGRGV
ncbi:hypothetical protein LCGC14_0446430 [marine sediment metagenome]|uniref:Radical SAM core domain-containing protein n=1 Tax=marine sediment metagenome TaxID=412755 RepID=A0A0F9VT80_9ZZZZ